MLAPVVFLFFLFLTFAAYALLSRKSEARSARLQQRVAEALEDSWQTEGEHVRLAREGSISQSAFLSRLLSPLSFTKQLDRLISQADMQITVSRLLAICIVAGVMATLTAFTVANSMLVWAAAGLVAGAAPLLHVSWKRKRRLAKFLEHLPDTLDLMSRSLAVGHAFSESLHQVSTEMPEPIATEFRIVFEEQKLGLSLKQALLNLNDRVPLLDLRLCITAIFIQRETGGNLSEILEKVSSTMRERVKLLEEFKTMTTSARGSAWILCGLPFAIVLVISWINPDYMKPLLYDTRGHYIIAAAAFMQLLGMITIRKILSIKF